MSVETLLRVANKHLDVPIMALWILTLAAVLFIVHRRQAERHAADEKQFERTMAEARLISEENARKRKRDAMAYLGKEQP